MTIIPLSNLSAAALRGSWHAGILSYSYKITVCVISPRYKFDS